ncbi:MAG TPA: AraC family transcriptional regulator [Terracidiphilus sp.]|nr:AraC family transcriptional regulator [Terracidiphilus sp.]
MPKPPLNRADLSLPIAELRKTLARKIAAFSPAEGEHRTSIPGLFLYRRSAPTPCYRATYEPSFTVFAQGRKRVNLGGTEYICDGSSFLLSSIDVPVESQILEASKSAPMLSMHLRLDMPTVREVLSRDDLPEPEPSSQRRGLAVGRTTVGFSTRAFASSTSSKRPTTSHF